MFVTNAHVENSTPEVAAANSWSDVIDENFIKKSTNRHYHFGSILNNNDLERNRSLWASHHFTFNDINVLWVTDQQVSKDGNSIRAPHDMIVYSIDLSKKLRKQEIKD